MNALKFIEKARYLSYMSRKNNLSNVIDALAIEILDENSLKFLAEDNSNLPPSAKAAIWFEQEVTNDNEDILLEEWTELINKFNGDEESVWFAFSEADNKKIQEFRHSLGSKVNEYISKNNLRKLGTDAAVSDDNFLEFYNFAKDTAKNANIDFIVFGHAGNSHIHLNMLPKNEYEFVKGKEVYKQICIKAVQLDGTVSAEHGIGKIKRDYLIDMYGIENIKKMAAIKKVLDPNWILGRGNIFSEDLV
jgi:D-lactate dehydrogenase (cytochrome)